ncbi:YopX family protein [Staphylococcus haemolyticus]|uniref:YopX family protein n=1 Tax=Staphylococcus haemolyticus TaxID=1283 RepID=UPI0039E3AA5F
MMIKFRVWDKEENKMHKVKTIEFSRRGARIIHLAEVNSNGKGDHKRWHSSVELMQSTGLKDKNGVEIYEGDIVELKYPYDKRIKTKGSIVWDRYKACFGISMKETTEQYELYRVTAENYLSVIGNVFENKNLLNEE